MCPRARGAGRTSRRPRSPAAAQASCSEAALDRLRALREKLGKPLIVRSAYRSPEHNRAVGGETRSKHMQGIAFDIALPNQDPAGSEAAAREAGFLGFGFYSRADFIHIVLGPKREWGERFAPRPPAPARLGPRANGWPRVARSRAAGSPAWRR